MKLMAMGVGTFGVLLCVLLLGQGSLAPKQGTGTLTGNIVRSEPGQPDPFIPILPVRLCSLDRVLQTKSDARHEFTFVNVPAGTYDLVVGGRYWKATIIHGVEIEDGKERSVTVNMNSGPEPPDSVCFRDTETVCGTTNFAVEYSQPSLRKAAVLLGRVINWESRGQKGFAQARLSLFRAGGTNPLYVGLSDKQGRFQVNLEPGIYDLTMSRKGFQDVKIPDFLVPLENDTEITIRTSRLGAVTDCL